MFPRVRFAFPIMVVLCLIAIAAGVVPESAAQGGGKRQSTIAFGQAGFIKTAAKDLLSDPITGSLSVWTDQQFTYNKGWRVDPNPRFVGDFNGDGKDDVAGVGDDNVWVGISTGRGFSLGAWHEILVPWLADILPFMVGDFNGDGKDDLMQFTAHDVTVLISDGSSFSSKTWIDDRFNYHNGWRVDKHPRLVGDFNGDGKDDVVGFGNNNVLVGLSTNGEASVSSWTNQQFTCNTGWRVDKHPRLVADLNGDGKDDIIGFGDQNVWVGLSTGSSFALSTWTNKEFTYNAGWRVGRHPRLMGDFNGDGKDDIAGFGDQNVLVGFSLGNGFLLSKWADEQFTYNTGWRVGRHPRLVGDLNGDGRDDVLGFGDQNVWAGISSKGKFELDVWTDREFTYNSGWRVDKHPRLLGDFNGDGWDDAVGFGDQNVWVGLSGLDGVFLPLITKR